LSAKPIILVLIGPGGVGKGTVARELVRRDPHLWLSRSWTSRSPRPEERGDEYVFVSREAFEHEIGANGFYEWAEFHGNLYGTPMPQPPEGNDVLLEIEIQGAAQVQERNPDAHIILLTPPSMIELESRLRSRGDDEEHVQRRLLSSDEELRIGMELATTVLENDDLEQVLTEISTILEGLRRTRR
jgi:guanylate kinase